MSSVAADPIDAGSIRPIHDLNDSTHLLDDWSALNAVYEAEGYLLLRSVLNEASIQGALRRMMDVMARHGIVESGAHEPLWIGKPLAGRYEESAEFSGICRDLISNPHNMQIFEKILGESVDYVPIVQYRSYPPQSPLLAVHQDGFYSPGIRGFRPLWIPLMTIDNSVGSLMLAPGQHKRGPLHRTDMPPGFPILADAVPSDTWSTTTFHAGDLLIVHPWTPHVGGANTSDRVRFSIDTRVQSARNPCVVLGNVEKIDSAAVTLDTPQGRVRLMLGEDTFIRTTERAGVRVPLAEVVDNVPIGMRVVASFDGANALMLRRAAEG